MFSGDNVTGGMKPLPLKATTCGLPGKLSLTLKFATKFAGDEGVKVTLTVQLPLAGKEAGQLLV